MPTRLNDLFTYALLIGVLVLAYCGANGCAPVPPKGPKWPTADKRVPVHAAVLVRGADWLCSGVAVDANTVVTATHCVANGSFEVEAYPGLRYTNVRVSVADEARDVAIVHVEPALGAVAELAPFLPLPGTLVYAVGFGCAQGRAPAVHAGAYVARDLDGDLVLAMGVCHGDSGGPVFDEQGRLFAIISKRAEPASVPLAFAAGL